MATFVAVGNATQSFSRMLDAVSALVPRLPKPIIVQHGNSSFQGEGSIPRPFMEMAEFCQLVAEADLLILHAGAGSVIHAIQAGKIPVVMPRLVKYGEHVDDHQLEFARALAEMGKVVLAEEPNDLVDAVADALRLQRAPRVSHDTPRLIGLIGAALHEYAQELRR